MPQLSIFLPLSDLPQRSYFSGVERQSRARSNMIAEGTRRAEMWGALSLVRFFGQAKK